MIFVDTSAWYAAIIPSDKDNAAVTSWLSGNEAPLLTTDDRIKICEPDFPL